MTTEEGQSVVWLKTLPSRFASSLPQQTSRTSTTLQKLHQPANLQLSSLIPQHRELWRIPPLLHRSFRLNLSCKLRRHEQKHTAESNSTLFLGLNINTLNLAVRLKAQKCKFQENRMFYSSICNKCSCFSKEEDENCKWGEQFEASNLTSVQKNRINDLNVFLKEDPPSHC